MSWETLGNAAAGGFGQSAGAAIGGQVLGSDPSFGDIRKGHYEDHRYYKFRDQYNWRQAEKRGLTPQEYYGSPAAGNSPAGNGAQVMGNQQQAKNTQIMQQAGQGVQASLDRENQKEIAEINKSSAENVAKIQSGATTRGQDINEALKSRELDQAVRQYEEVTVKQAAKQLKKTDKEIEYLVNQIALSEPKFVRMLKIMTMGTDNTLGLAIQNTLGIDVSDVEQMQNLSPSQRQKLIQGMMAAGSVAAKEIAGGQQTVSQYLDSFVNALQKAGQGISDTVKPGIEPTLGAPKNRGPRYQ